MKLISLNIWIKLDNCAAVIEFLRIQNADIICLQEVSSTPNGTISMYTKKHYIDEALWEVYPYRFRWSLFSTTLLWTSEREVWWVMEQWNYILSKIPFINQWHNFYYQWFRHITDRSDRRKNDHWRALTWVTIDTKQWPILIGNVHGCWTADKQSTPRTMHQIKQIIEITTNYKKVLLLWNFNLLPETPEIKLLESHFQNAWKIFSIASTRPDFDDGLDKGNQIIDYAFVSQDSKIIDFQVPSLNISDHLALLLEI